MGAESQGSLQEPVAAVSVKLPPKKDSRAAERDIVKVTKGAVRLFLFIYKGVVSLTPMLLMSGNAWN